MLALPPSTPAEKPYTNLVNSTQVCNPQSVPHPFMLLMICHSVCKKQLSANEARMEKNNVSSGDTLCIAEKSKASWVLIFDNPAQANLSVMLDWGYNDFRHPQLEICTDALRGCDLIVVAPTGLGKS